MEHQALGALHCASQRLCNQQLVAVSAARGQSVSTGAKTARPAHDASRAAPFAAAGRGEHCTLRTVAFMFTLVKSLRR